MARRPGRPSQSGVRRLENSDRACCSGFSGPEFEQLLECRWFAFMGASMISKLRIGSMDLLTTNGVTPVANRRYGRLPVGATVVGHTFWDQEPRQHLGVRQSPGAIQYAPRSKAPGDWRRTPKPSGDLTVHGRSDFGFGFIRPSVLRVSDFNWGLAELGLPEERGLPVATLEFGPWTSHSLPPTAAVWSAGTRGRPTATA